MNTILETVRKTAKPKRRYRYEVAADGWLWRIDTKTDNRERTNRRVAYPGGRPLYLGINEVERIARASGEKHSKQNKVIRSYKNEAWSQLDQYYARMRGQKKVSKLRRSKKVSKK